jgi:DNA-binding NarL/FixJ family response regulator
MSQKYTVLHLDDNPVFINITKALFEKKEDIAYESAFTTNEAYGFIESKQPDLIFVDLMLEGFGDPEPGVNFIEKVKKNYPQLRMLVFSGYPEPDAIKERLADNIIHYEEKGCDPKNFVTNVARLLSEG